MQNKIYARLLFYLFLIQSQLSPIQAQAVQHYTDRTTCHGSTDQTYSFMGKFKSFG